MKTQNTLRLGFSARHLAKGGLLAALLCLFPALTRAETAVQEWVQRYNGPGNTIDSASAVAVDGSNNVVVTGQSYASNGFPDYATIKYSSGGVPLWTNRYNGPANSGDWPRALAVDGSNNVIVTGNSFGSGVSVDYLTIKYSSAGVPLWTNRYNGPANSGDSATAIAVDGSNNVIVTGRSPGSGSGQDYATIKYSSGGVPLWINRYNGPGNIDDYAYAVAVDGSNNVIVTGGTDDNGAGTDEDYATIKYSGEGVPLWTNRYDGPGNSYDFTSAVAVDASNNVIVTGTSVGSGSGRDYATIKYSSEGVPLWTQRYDGPGTNNDFAYAMAVDGSDNVIVAGSSADSEGSADYATIKYSSTGVPLWTNRYNGPGNGWDAAYAIAMDCSGNVIVTGPSSGSDSSVDYATIKYSSAGLPLWANRYNGPGNAWDGASAVAVDRSGNVIVTGYSAGTNGYDDYATIKYVSPPMITGLTQPDGTFQLRLDNPAQAPTLVIEASTDLAGWVPVFTNTTPTNVLFYTDPETGSHLWRFYRAFQFP